MGVSKNTWFGETKNTQCLSSIKLFGGRGGPGNVDPLIWSLRHSSVEAMRSCSKPLMWHLHHAVEKEQLCHNVNFWQSLGSQRSSLEPSILPDRSHVSHVILQSKPARPTCISPSILLSLPSPPLPPSLLPFWSLPSFISSSDYQINYSPTSHCLPVMAHSTPITLQLHSILRGVPHHIFKCCLQTAWMHWKKKSTHYRPMINKWVVYLEVLWDY